MFDLAGKIVLHDAFSQPLTNLQQKSARAEAAVVALGKSADQSLTQGMSHGAGEARQRVQEIGQQFSQLQRRAQQPITPKISTGALDELAAKTNAAGSSFAALKVGGQGLTMMLHGLYAATVGSVAVLSMLRLASSMVELTRLGAQAQGVEQVFENMSRNIGVSGNELLRQMRRASRGTMDEVELMKAANRAMLAGGQEFATKLPDLLSAASAAALATGQDLGFVFETLTKGIAKASPLLIDNAEIYIKVGSAMEEYAAKQGKTVEQLSKVEQSAALANIVLAQSADLIKQTGLESITAAEMMDNLPAAMRDAKIALGELLSETGLPLWMAALAEITRMTTVKFTNVNELKARIDELNLLGATDDAKNFADALAQLQAGKIAIQPDELPSEAIAREYARVIDLADKLIARHKGVTDAQLAGAAAAQEAAQRQRELTDAWQPYVKALNEFRSKSSGQVVLMEQMGQLSGQLESLRSGLAAPMPKLGDTLAPDTQAVRQWLDTLSATTSELAAAKAATLEQVTALEEHTHKIVTFALAVQDHGVALEYLAQQVLGPTAGIEDLAASFGTLPPEVQAAAEQLGLFEATLRTLQGQADRGVTVDIQVSGYASGMQQIDSLALRLAGILSADEIRAFREQMRDDFTQHWRQMGDIDQFGMALQKAVILGGYQDVADATVEHYRELERAAQNHASAMYSSASELSSAIEQAIKRGLEVSPEDMQLASVGLYRDKALEAARRLDAILQRGFAELQAHPDWAGLLQIPESVLSGSEAELKAWAARTKEDVVDLARPDLINWDAFIENFRRDMDKEAAKKLTIDIAVEKLVATGELAGMSPEQRKKMVAEKLGLEAPELTIEAVFKTLPGARKQVVTDFLEGDKAVSIPAQLEIEPPTGTPAGVQRALDVAKPDTQALASEIERVMAATIKLQTEVQFLVPEGAADQIIADLLAGAPGLSVPVDFTPPTTPPELQVLAALTLGEGANQQLFADLLGADSALMIPAILKLSQDTSLLTPTLAFDEVSGLGEIGVDAAMALQAGFQGRLISYDLASNTLGVWRTQFGALYPDMRIIGQGLGGVMAGAFVTAVKEGVGNVRAELAAIIAPEVEAILARHGRGRSASP